jgi:hypothetical protein
MMLACGTSESGCKSITPENLLGDQIRVAMALPSEGYGSSYGFSAAKAAVPRPWGSSSDSSTVGTIGL